MKSQELNNLALGFQENVVNFRNIGICGSVTVVHHVTVAIVVKVWVTTK
jgi:hypothetical protein